MAHVLAKDLRDAVLQAGIQGKLTNQLNSDTSVKESLLDISTEKKKQIKEKLMKNEKLPSEIKESEITLAIPESWQFVRLGDVVKLLSGQDLTPDRYSDKPNGIPYITGASNFYDGSIVINRYTLSPTSVALKGDLLITCKGTVGELAYLKVEKAHIARQIMSISTIGNMNLQYVELLLRNFIETLKSKAKSIIPGIDRKTILSLVIPFPPIEEQQRIVDRVDELMAKIDEYEKLENQLVQLKEQFPKDMRDSLLQAGMMGKLTEHLESDTSVNIPVVANNTDAYFGEIPDTWKYVHLGNVFNIRSASRVHKADWRNRGVPFYRAREVVKLAQNGSVENELYIDEELYEKFAKSSGVPKVGDLLVSGVGTLGATYIVKETDRFYYKDASVLCFENINNQNSNFAKYLLNTPYMIKQIYDQSAFGTTVATLTMKRANVFVVALPPLEEQQRIVDKLDEMLPLVDALAQMD